MVAFTCFGVLDLGPASRGRQYRRLYRSRGGRIRVTRLLAPPLPSSFFAFPRRNCFLNATERQRARDGSTLSRRFGPYAARNRPFVRETRSREHHRTRTRH